MTTDTTLQTINNIKLLKLGERFLTDYENKKVGLQIITIKLKMTLIFYRRNENRNKLIIKITGTKLINTIMKNTKMTKIIEKQKREADKRYYNNITAFNVINKRDRKPKIK